ncbi:MAG: crossover junction endodeoxyribonuclease RuvC [Ignavibacteriales bacterium]|nr:crossover junction endodeoxyribonuclease RuvC [Ignavibacteriales bacterium]
MKKLISRKVLAIDPGTRHLGVAFFEGKELIYYGVKTIKHMNLAHETLKEGKKAILRMIHDFKPEILVVEKTFFSNNRNSALLNVFADEIQTIGKRQGLKVYAYAANTVRKQICGNGSASKDEVAKVVVSYYPELKPYLTSDRKWKEIFHRNMFDAVALGLIAVNKI